jgi:hypothetical protein
MALAALAFSGAARPAAAMMSGPIEIFSCTIENSNGSVGSGALHIVWMNTKALPATSIRFHVTYAGQTLNIRDHGSFARDAKIDKRYNAFNGVSFVGPKPSACSVQQVTYSDGSIIAP